MTEREKITKIAKRWLYPFPCDGCSRVVKQLEEKFGPVTEGRWPKYVILADGVTYRIIDTFWYSIRTQDDWIREWNPYEKPEDALELMAAMQPVIVKYEEGVWYAESHGEHCIGDRFELAVTGVALALAR